MVPTLPGSWTPCNSTMRPAVESSVPADTSTKGKTPTGPVGVVSVERRRTSPGSSNSLFGGSSDSRIRASPSARNRCSASRCFLALSVAARLSEIAGVPGIRTSVVVDLRFGRVLHVADGDAPALARALHGGEVHAEFLGLAFRGFGGVYLALFFGSLLHVRYDYLIFGAGGLDGLEVHRQLLRPALGGVSGLDAPLPLHLRLGPRLLRLLSLHLPLDLDAPLNGLRVQGVSGLRHDRGEGFGFGGGEVCKDLAVEIYLGEPQAVDEPRVGEAVLARGGAYALDPERPEVPLALFAPLIGVDTALPHLFLGFLVRAALLAPVTLRLLEYLATLLAGVNAARRAGQLPHPHKTPYPLLVRAVYDRLSVEPPLALGTLLLEDVVMAGPTPPEPALLPHLEAPHSALVGLHLRLGSAHV